MRVLSRLSGDIDSYSLKRLKNLGFVNSTENLNIFEDDIRFNQALEIYQEQPRFSLTKSGAFFSKSEVENSEFLILRWAPPDVSLIIPNTKYDLLNYVYGELCDNCKLPLNYKQNNNLIKFSKEPIVKDKYIAISNSTLNNIWFTTKEKYELLFKNFGVNFRPISIMNSKNAKSEIIQLEFDYMNGIFNLENISCSYSESLNLSNNNGEYGIYDACLKCNQKKYSPKSLDYFPTMDVKINSNIAITQEWFGWYHHLIISNDFYYYLLKLNIIKFKDGYTHLLIPVKKS